jgi:hydroxyacylglutathione hydrolase
MHMFLERIVSEGLAHYSYILGSGTEAAVIDPRRDVDVYLQLSREKGVRITRIFETHKNEDYVIGSRTLAEATGAEIYHGHAFPFEYGTPVREGDVFLVGNLIISVLETPGHTVESISLAVREKDGPDRVLMVFTGDALFAGDVGRTDFYPGRMEQMAGALHDSLWMKILPMGNQAVVYPAHGAGSVCGEAISDRTITTIGYEKEGNPALGMTREEFVRFKVQEHHYTPPYFQTMEVWNTKGDRSMPAPAPVPPLSIDQVKTLRSKGAQLVDLRAPSDFGGGYVPGSINIWREGIPLFIGWVLNYQDPIVFIDEFNLDLDSVVRSFYRMGYDRIAGYCAGGFPAWSRMAGDVGFLEQWTPETLRDYGGTPFILDVRNIQTRTKIGHISGSHHCWVGDVPAHLTEVPRDRLVVTYCDAGYKGNMAASILCKHGFPRVVNLLGGMAAWKTARLPVEQEDKRV